MEETTQTATPQVAYASFFSRVLASLIDAILIGFGTGLLLGLLGFGDTENSAIRNIPSLVSVVYNILMIHKYGFTIGKKVLGIKVQSKESGQNLDVVSALVRETVGKMLSGVVLGLGYFWMLWDKDKQTWHDKLAKSIVVRR